MDPQEKLEQLLFSLERVSATNGNPTAEFEQAMEDTWQELMFFMASLTQVEIETKRDINPEKGYFN